MMWSLLDEEIVPVETAGGVAWRTLPGALAMMASGEASRFAHVRPHQRHGLHMFAVQLACMSMMEKGLTSVPASEDGWRECLLALAPVEAWCLVVEDPDKPAFMQPPMGKADYAKAIAKTENHSAYPDDMTVMVRSKNHVTKFARMDAPSPWHWAVSLIELQTLSSFEGRGLYGIARMNGGLGSRFMVGVYDSLEPAAMWRRDVRRVLGFIPRIRTAISAYQEDKWNHCLLWLPHWDGKAKLALSEVHPLFIEVCRRLRLFVDGNGRIAFTYLPTSGTRLEASKQNGLVGDPWTPANEKNVTSIGVKRFDVKTLRDIVITDSHSPYRPALLQEIDGDDPQELFFRLTVIVGGKGKTEGFHEIVIPIPGKAREFFFTEDRVQALGATANGMLQEADKAWTCLRRAIYAFVQNGADEIAWQDHRQSEAVARIASEKFKPAYEESFFENLWRLHETGDRTSWKEDLKASALGVLEDLMDSHVSRTQLEYRARSAALGMFHGLWNKELSDGGTK